MSGRWPCGISRMGLFAFRFAPESGKCAVQLGMSALHPIATTKADMCQWSCLLCQADVSSALAYVCIGPQADIFACEVQ
jgi:hypothetical protein